MKIQSDAKHFPCTWTMTSTSVSKDGEIMQAKNNFLIKIQRGNYEYKHDI
jgi:hypothetical protein